MKKRLRRKLRKKEFANPYPHTKAHYAACALIYSAVAAAIAAQGIDSFIAQLNIINEAA